ncbi:MAG: integration host factor subunit alpha [Brachymonas sp.]
MAANTSIAAQKTGKTHKKNMEFDHLETPTLTKAQLSELLHQEVGLNKRESKDIVDAFFYMLSDAVIQGQDVKITGFGNFQVRAKAARPGRNPRTSEAVAIAPRHVVTFHASQKLKELLQGQVETDGMPGDVAAELQPMV